MFPGHRWQDPVPHYLNNQLFFVPFLEKGHNIYFRRRSTAQRPHSASGAPPGGRLRDEFAARDAAVCSIVGARDVIAKASKCSSLFYSLKSMGERAVAAFTLSFFFLSVNI